jgi:hypothetical protein
MKLNKNINYNKIKLNYPIRNHRYLRSKMSPQRVERERERERRDTETEREKRYRDRKK